MQKQPWGSLHHPVAAAVVVAIANGFVAVVIGGIVAFGGGAVFGGVGGGVTTVGGIGVATAIAAAVVAATVVGCGVIGTAGFLRPTISRCNDDASQTPKKPLTQQRAYKNHKLVLTVVTKHCK